MAFATKTLEVHLILSDTSLYSYIIYFYVLSDCAKNIHVIFNIPWDQLIIVDQLIWVALYASLFHRPFKLLQLIDTLDITFDAFLSKWNSFQRYFAPPARKQNLVHLTIFKKFHILEKVVSAPRFLEDSVFPVFFFHAIFCKLVFARFYHWRQHIVALIQLFCYMIVGWFQN